MKGIVIRWLVSATLFLSVCGCGVHRESLNADGTPSFRGAGLGSGDPRYVASASYTARVGEAQANYINAHAEAVRNGRYPAGYSGLYTAGLPTSQPLMAFGDKTLYIGNESAWNIHVRVTSQTPGVECGFVVEILCGRHQVVYVPSAEYMIEGNRAINGRYVRHDVRWEIPDRSVTTYNGMTYNSVWVAR